MRAARERLREWRGIIFLVLIILVVALLSAHDSGPITPPYDVTSSKPDGTKALSLLLDHFGTRLDVNSTISGDTAVLFQDDLTQGESDRVAHWVAQGGTLVVATTDTPLSDETVGGKNVFEQPRSLMPACSDQLAGGVRSIEPSKDLSYDVLVPKPDETTCFPGYKGVFMAVQREGLGSVVSLGSPDLFTNQQLGKADNSVLAINLLGASPGKSVTILHTTSGGAGGHQTLNGLIPGSVKAAMLQLVVGFGLFLGWRSRRLGMPVMEVDAVEIAGSQLTVAVGNLLQTAGQANAAAHTLRSDLRASIADLIGLDSRVDPRVLAQVTSDRTGIDRNRLHAVLVDQPVAGGEELVILARQIEEVYREVAHAR